MKSNDKKILFIYYKLFKAGGVARVLVSLANELVSENNEIIILFLIEDESSFYNLDKRVKIICIDTFCHWGFRYINVNLDKYFSKLPYKNNIKNYVYDFGQWQILNNWINDNHYDIIIACWYKLSAQLALNKNVSYKTIAWEHANFEVGGKIWKDILRPHYKNLKAIVCINSNSYQEYLENNTDTYLIPNLIGEPFESYSIHLNFRKENTLLYVGRLDSDKNVEEILSIFNLIYLSDFIFKIIGDGPQRKMLEDIVNESELLKDKVYFLGNKRTNQVFEELSKSKVFLFASKTEAFAMVLVEAMMTANVLIAYDCNYGPSDILNENNGFLIPMHDKKLFQEKLQYLIDNPKVLENLSHTSYLDSKKWKKNEIIKKWEKILDL